MRSFRSQYDPLRHGRTHSPRSVVDAEVRKDRARVSICLALKKKQSRAHHDAELNEGSDWLGAGGFEGLTYTPPPEFNGTPSRPETKFSLQRPPETFNSGAE